MQVDVEVYLCYCTGEECNKEDITAGGDRIGRAILALLWSTLVTRITYD